MRLFVLVLAAGLGKRMNSSKPKVLQNLASKPLIKHVLDTVRKLNAKEVGIVYGHLAEKLKAALSDYQVTWIEQKEYKGTGDAVKSALPFLKSDDRVLILYGDVPLISYETLQNFMLNVDDNQIGLLTAFVDNPYGLGRVIRDDKGAVIEIIEEKDATDKERQIQEINTGIYYLSARHLDKWLPNIKNHNAQNEYYLTDIIKMAKNDHIEIITYNPSHLYEITGVNDRKELSLLERVWQRYQVENIMNKGVTVVDPSRLDIRGDVDVGCDTLIDVNVILKGIVKIGKDCHIGANCILKDVEIADSVIIEPNSMIENTKIDSHARIGPFARVRPECVIAKNAKVGNFVELKKTSVGEGSKINHLSYIGDTQVGSDVNIGAGVITCNYDGVNKYQTIIEDEVFVGSDSQLVAPVRLAKGAYIGSGSTITKNAPKGKLTINRSNRQITIDSWKKPNKKDK